MTRKILTLAFMTAAIALMQGCSGTAAPNYPAPSSLNPAPGVTLQAIQITPSTSLISLAENRQLTALGVYNDGSMADLTSQVAWNSSSVPSTTNFVAVSSKGVVTGTGIGASVVSATLGPVVGLIDLTVNTNGYTSGTTAILSVPYKTTVVDAAYLPQSLTKIQGAYAVQEVNLDADQFSSVLPVPLALLASIPMPAGFVPNATAASQSNFLVAVISYSSPNVQVIDASNLSLDLANNTIIATFSAPVSQSVTLNGITCMICAAVVNPVNNLLILSTAQGYYTMDMVAGTFKALPFTPAPAPSASISLNPIATNPYILAPNPTTGEIQVLNLTTNAVTTVSSGLTAPGAVALDLLTDYAAVVDANTNNQSLVTLTDPQNPTSILVPSVGVCGQPTLMNMVAMGVSASAVVSNTAHTLFTSQTLGSCVGLQVWPTLSSSALNPFQILYGYGSMPGTPDGNPFLNGNDPNSIATFTSVVDKKNYGLLVDGNQQWIAKINFNTVLSLANIGPGNGNTPLPVGQVIPPADLSAGVGGDPILFLPTPSTAVTLSVTSINFGNVNVGTSSSGVPVTLTNIGTVQIAPQITVLGANANDFLLTSNCADFLQPHSSCGINVSFTPTAKGPRSATLSIASSGAATQTVPLSGSGT